jgi:LmbE family N-acetylglucosaminyl deacetylase
MPAIDTGSCRNVLAIFAHADDELVCCGGTLRRLAGRGARVTLVVLTRGERGTPDGSPDPGLPGVREREARAAAAIFGVAELVLGDLGDGRLSERAEEVSAFVEGVAERVRPDLLITHDLAGLYGHPDHVACAEAVTAIRRTRFPDCALWYPALPRWAVAVATRTGQLAGDGRRAVPTLRLFVGAGVPAKVRAYRAYRSQRHSLRRGLPLVLTPFEHFEAA